MKFFLDNCISPRFARALKILAEVQQYEITHLAEKFDRSEKDENWLKVLGIEGGWVIVSADPRISRGKAEQKAWRESGLTAFFFGHGWANMGYWKQAEAIVRWWPQIVLEATRAEPGTGYMIPLKGKELQPIYTSVQSGK